MSGLGFNMQMITKTSNHLLSLLLYSARAHAIILMDLQGRIVAWLGGAEQIFGYREDEVIGKPSSMLFTPEDINRHIPEYELQTATLNAEAEDDRWMLRKDGIRFWATGVLIPLCEEDGKLVGFGKVLRNRTDLRGLLESLEHKLETEQKINERKNNFISTLSHELRNPLAAAGTALELMNRKEVSNNDHVFARTAIRRQLDHIARMVEDLLDISRIGAGKLRLEKKVVCLNDVIRASIETCRPSIDARRHNFQLLIVDTPIMVEADAVRLEQVFVNLIQNATKYTQYEGDIWVKVDCDGEDALVRVEDTGIGISAEMLPRIFDLFTQSEVSPGDKGQFGLGIGLSVVKDLVTLHEGMVSVTSDGIGKGSKFFVRLPLVKPVEQGPDEPDSK